MPILYMSLIVFIVATKVLTMRQLLLVQRKIFAFFLVVSKKVLILQRKTKQGGISSVG